MTDTSPAFDLIVLGAGPAGSSAAATAAKAGLRVGLLDKASFPRQKLCGGLFTGRSRAHLNEIFGCDLPKDMTLEKRDIAFSFEGRPVPPMRDVPPMWLTMRWDLDSFLVDKALQAGAVDLTGRSVAELDLAGRLTLKDGAKLGFKTLIGADGVNSMVARQLFGAAFDHGKIGFGLEIEADAVDPDAPIQIDLAAAAWGYGWSFPKTGSTTIGVGGRHELNPEMKAAMAAYVARIGAEAKPYKGHFLPWGDYRKLPGRGNILLAGDAAGLVDPITGEGIALAMKSGQLAAHSAAEALRRRQPEAALALYRTALRPLHRSMRMANMIRPLIFSKGMRGYLERAFRRSSTLKQAYMRLLAGEVEYGDILRALILRIPRILVGVTLTKLGLGRKPPVEEQRPPA